MFKRDGRPSRVSNPLRKILIIILLFVMLPALFYSSLEIFSLNEDEKMIYQIFEQQLDVVLFSINQYVWDYINNWKRDIEANVIYKSANEEIEATPGFVTDNSSMQYFMLADTLLTNKMIHSTTQVSNTQVDVDLKNIESPEKLIHRLQRYERAGYQKVESILLRGDEATGDERMILVSLTKSGHVLFMMVNFRPFIEEVIVPKLQEIALDGLAIGVFTGDTRESIYQNESFEFTDSQISKKLWLFPDYLVAIRTKGKSLQELASNRFRNTLIYNSILLLTLLTGAIILFRNIRKEVQLAQMKSDFVSNVSHELRTPLALIRMYAETLEMGRVKNDGKREEYYQIINKESERLTRLINNILNFSRIESGQKEYSFQKVDLNTVIKETSDVYAYHIQSKGFKVDVKLADNLPLVAADSEAITECIINLMDNAVKYSKDKKNVTIVSGQISDFVFIEISDKGIGISQKDLKHIFDKFFRVSSGLVHNTKGSGLGLTLVQHIVHAHNGKIEVDSIPGEGTTFRLLFPC